MLVSDVTSCSFDSWYKKFESNTLERLFLLLLLKIFYSVCIELGDDFRQYLLHGDFFVPKRCVFVCNNLSKLY